MYVLYKTRQYVRYTNTCIALFTPLMPISCTTLVLLQASLPNLSFCHLHPSILSAQLIHPAMTPKLQTHIDSQEDQWMRDYLPSGYPDLPSAQVSLLGQMRLLIKHDCGLVHNFVSPPLCPILLNCHRNHMIFLW
jgi:hypothetical protein